jgi:hypothetical protein
MKKACQQADWQAFHTIFLKIGDSGLMQIAAMTFENKETLLHFASGGPIGHRDIVEMLIRQGKSNLNAQNSKG